MSELEKLKLKIKDKSDEELQLLLEDSEQAILDYTNRDVITDKMLPLVRELALYYYNIENSEGESSRSEGGVSVSYSLEIPQMLKNRLRTYRKSIMCRWIGDEQ